MNAYVERTCTEVGNEKEVSLSDYRDSDAYVLLGGPGSGKTRSFKEEAWQTKDGEYVSAHDFVELCAQNEWRNKVLFVDGLDELRASSPSPEPLGRIRARLDALGKPRFRLSCRDADWYGTVDAGDLTKVSRDGCVTELKLNPLSDDQVGEFLETLKVPDARAFTNRAREDGNAPLLRNPLSLTLLVRAAASFQPVSRKEAFEAACRSLLREDNSRHARSRQRQSFSLDDQLDAAGHLCAVALLAGKRGYCVDAGEAGKHWIAVEDAPVRRDLLDSVLRTRLFGSDDGRFAPMHHHIAEFLAGRHLAGRVAADLPIGRAMALMTGFDGGVVAALRGVWAWFAAHCTVDRGALIDGDPLGTVLYGDVKQFSVADKQRLLDGVRRRSGELTDLPRDVWRSPRWADVATDDAAHLIWDAFSKAPHSEEGQWVALLLADTPERHLFTDLRPLLLSVIRDERLWDGTRHKALRWLIRQFGDAPTLEKDLIGLLSAIEEGQLSDSEDEMTGRLLCELYPHRLSLADAKRFFHAPKNPDLLGYYQHFWITVALEKAVESDSAEAVRLYVEFRRLTNEATSEDDAPEARITP